MGHNASVRMVANDILIFISVLPAIAVRTLIKYMLGAVKYFISKSFIYYIAAAFQGVTKPDRGARRFGDHGGRGGAIIFQSHPNPSSSLNNWKRKNFSEGPNENI